MITVDILTSDNKIWNQNQVFTQLALAVSSNQPFKIDLLKEGPDLDHIGLYQYLLESGANFENITISTANALEQHHAIHIEYRPSMHLLDQAKHYLIDIEKNQQFKHFGLFVGRSNAPRLHLATHVQQCHPTRSLLSYHLDINNEFHSSNIGLEDLIKYWNFKDIQQEAKFVSQCPITLGKCASIHPDKSINLNHAQQLLKNDFPDFSLAYNDFFVEIVCESFYTGNTFFPTEKIFRPMLLKTPFIVQGPRYFLHNLKKLGFKTFNHWWDEGYAEDPAEHQLFEIKKILNFLSRKTPAELYGMYQEMSDVLQHNYHTALTLTPADFFKVRQ